MHWLRDKKFMISRCENSVRQAASHTFIATWYLLGMLIPTAIGAWLGPRLFALVNSEKLIQNRYHRRYRTMTLSAKRAALLALICLGVEFRLCAEPAGAIELAARTCGCARLIYVTGL